MAGRIIYLEIDDEITTAAARIRDADVARIAIVLPHGSRVATSRINFRLLSRDALTHEKRLSIVAADAATRALAASAGLPVFGSVAEYEGGGARPRRGGSHGGVGRRDRRDRRDRRGWRRRALGWRNAVGCRGGTFGRAGNGRRGRHVRAGHPRARSHRTRRRRSNPTEPSAWSCPRSPRGPRPARRAVGSARSDRRL